MTLANFLPFDTETDGVYDLDQIRPGFRLQLPRWHRSFVCANLYRGRYESDLFPVTPTVENGLKLLGSQKPTNIPLFSVGATFYKNTTKGETGPNYIGRLSEPQQVQMRPAPSPEGDSESPSEDRERTPDQVTNRNPQFERWYAEHASYLDRQLDRALLDWAIYDRLIMATLDDGQLRVIPDYNYLRVGPYSERDTVTGHVVIRRYRQQQPSDSTNLIHLTMPPDRVKVTKFDATNNRSSVQHYVWEGAGFVDGSIGAPIDAPDNTDNAGIKSFITGGEGNPWFWEAREVAAELMINHTLLMRQIYYHDNHILTLPSGLTPETIAKLRSTVNPMISVSSDDTGKFGSTAFDEMTGYSDKMAQQNKLYSLVSIISSIPPQVWGQDIAAHMTGDAIREVEGAAKAKMNQIRSDLRLGLPIILKGMGARGEISVNWTYPPMQSNQQNTQYVAELYSLGIITLQEARIMLGNELIDVRSIPTQEVR